MAKKFLLLGSCRVVNTIAYEIGDNILLNRNDLWFTHYLDEHIQKIKHLFGMSLIPHKYKELFVRYEQQNHYEPNMGLRVGDSIENGIVELHNDGFYGTLNVIVELPTTRYIKVPIENKIMYGHMTNLDLIRTSPFTQVGGHYTDKNFLELLNGFEQIILASVLSHHVAEDVKFIYVPHSPFIELKGGGWSISDQRTHIYDLISQHCLIETVNSTTQVAATRCSLDVRTMIEENGGVEYMMEDQNHYSTYGRKIAFKYLSELAQ